MTTKKKVISGSLSPRWPKPRVVRWLEVGAVPALLGLFVPDWVGGYARAFGAGAGSPVSVAFPPALTYVGAVILLIACAQGIREMGTHYRALRAFGALAVAFAGLSVAAHFLVGEAPGKAFALLVASVGLACFFASAALLTTIAKVAEITTETRTRLAKAAGLAGASLGLGASLVAAAEALRGTEGWVLWLRVATLVFGATFLVCRYGVHCYKTQRSIGATFAVAPEEQFWV